MHVIYFAKFFETLNCYIKKNYEMKYRNNCKIFASTRAEFNNQLKPNCLDFNIGQLHDIGYNHSCH